MLVAFAANANCLPGKANPLDARFLGREGSRSLTAQTTGLAQQQVLPLADPAASLAAVEEFHRNVQSPWSQQQTHWARVVQQRLVTFRSSPTAPTSWTAARASTSEKLLQRPGDRDEKASKSVPADGTG